MKRVITLFIAFLALSLSAFAYNYTNEDKQEFYDAFSTEFFSSMNDELISNGFQKSGVYIYSTQLKSRFNRTELENASWACIAKYSPEQLSKDIQGITHECFASWIENFIGKNSDLAQKYLSK